MLLFCFTLTIKKVIDKQTAFWTTIRHLSGSCNFRVFSLQGSADALLKLDGYIMTCFDCVCPSNISAKNY